MTDDDRTDDEQAAADQATYDELLETDPIRAELFRRDRGQAARRFLAALTAGRTPTNPTS